jgi:hypothetical protein
MTTPSTTRVKRFLTDIKKRIPTVPSDLATCGLLYPDLLKLDKRASDLSVSELLGGERLRWVKSTLENLEKWAEQAIEADKSKDVRAIRQAIRQGEESFSKAFIRTVPLYKLLNRANRKRLRLLEDYESRTDEWLPLTVSTSPLGQLDGIVSDEDSGRLEALLTKWNSFVSSGYFDLQMALELLHGVHHDDLTQHSSYPLLQKALKLLSLDLGKIDSEPLYVRVRSSVISKLIAVVALSPAFGKGTELPATYAKEVQKAIDKASDPQFRKLCDHSMNLLLIRTYPQKVSSLIEHLHRPYGVVRKPVTQSRKRKQVQVRNIDGMRTRSAANQSSTMRRLKQVSLSVLERTLKEGERLARVSKHDRDISRSVEELQAEIEKIESKRSELETILESSDISTWIPLDMSNTELLWVYKLELGFVTRKILAAISGLRPELFRDQLDAAKSCLSRLRIEKTLIVSILTNEPVPYSEIESIMNSQPYGGTDSGALKLFAETYSGLKAQLKQKLTGLTVNEVQAWLDSISSSSLVSTEGCEQVIRARTVVQEADSLVSSIERLLSAIGAPHTMAGDFGSIEEAAEKIESMKLSSSLSVMLAKLTEVCSQVTLVADKTEKISWIDWLRAVEWFIKAHGGNTDINTLIELHREAVSGKIGHTGKASKDQPLLSLVKSIEDQVSTITDLLSEVEKGDFSKISQLESNGLIAAQIERVKMDIEDYRGCLEGVSEDRSDISMNRVKAVIETVRLFNETYSRMDTGLVDDLQALVDANQSLPELNERDEVEKILSQLSRFVSDEIEKAKRHLEKTKELESQVENATRKSDSVNTSWSKLVDIAEAKYQLLKKSSKLKIGLSNRGLRKLVSSLHATLCNLVQQQTGSKPKWTHLFMLKTIGVWLETPSPWVTKQLDACTEILKDAKKSLGDFARVRFMVPLFHVSLYEPLERIRKNMETASQVRIALNFVANERRLESVSSHDKTDGKVRERIFPKLGGPSKSALVEPSDSTAAISDLFERRRTKPIESITQAVEQLLLVGKSLVADHRELSALKHRVGAGQGIGSSDQSTGGMSFTKFLSSSFANLDINVGAGPVLDQDQLDSLLASGTFVGKNFMDRYYDMLLSKKVPSPTASGATTPLHAKRSSATSVMFAPPPKAAAAAVSPVAEEPAVGSPQLVVWKGDLVAPKTRLPISLTPLFRKPSPQIIRSVLANHTSWQFEGSLGISKFAEHYAKLMHPQHRAKREPYSFLVSSLMESERFFDCLPVNTAAAFTLIVAPYKVKLWIVCGDGSVGFQPVPLLPRIVSGFVEMPLPLLPKNVGVLENIFDQTELGSAVNTLQNELESLQAGTLMVAPVPVSSQVVQAPPVSSKPKEEDVQISQVLHAFASGPSDAGARPIDSGVRMVDLPKPPAPAGVRAVEFQRPSGEGRPPIGVRPIEFSGEARPPTGVRTVEFPAEVRPPPGVRPVDFQRPPSDVRPVEFQRPPSDVRTIDFQRPPSDVRPVDFQRPPADARGEPQYPPAFRPPPSEPVRQQPAFYNPMSAFYGRPTGAPAQAAPMPSLVIGAPSTGPNIEQLPNPKRGGCRFFNTAQGCQSGSRCKFAHSCSVCGSEEHGAIVHEPQQPPQGFYRY